MLHGFAIVSLKYFLGFRKTDSKTKTPKASGARLWLGSSLAPDKAESPRDNVV